MRVTHIRLAWVKTRAGICVAQKGPTPFQPSTALLGAAVGSQVGSQYGRGEPRLGNHGYSGKALLSREETWRVHMLSHLSQDTLRTLTTCRSPHRVSCLTQLLGSSQIHHFIYYHPKFIHNFSPHSSFLSLFPSLLSSILYLPSTPLPSLMPCI